MILRDRVRELRRLSALFAELPEREADFLLNQHGRVVTPVGYDGLSRDRRQGVMLDRLSGMDNEMLQEMRLLSLDPPDAWETRLATAYAALPPGEVRFIFNQAGVRGFDTNEYATLAPKVRRAAMLQVVGNADPDTRRTLAELVDLEAEAPGVPVDGASPPPPAPVVAQQQDAADGEADPRGQLDDLEPAVDETGPIFVVHGHSRAVLHEAVRILERATGREVIVLHEQPNAGRTILEKFEHHAAGASYAVVLLTGDDEGGAVGTSQSKRGRQNVILELGFFFGKLGRKRVAVLIEEGVEKPSDIDGLVYVSLDGAGAWKHALAKELASADIGVDFSRLF